jgi:hypothetical protein
VGTDAQNLSALVSTDCSLSLDGHLNTPSVPPLRNLRAYPRNQTYETLQEYTAEPVLIGVSFAKRPAPEMEAYYCGKQGLSLVIPKLICKDVKRYIIVNAVNIQTDVNGH